MMVLWGVIVSILGLFGLHWYMKVRRRRKRRENERLYNLERSYRQEKKEGRDD